VPDGDLSLRKLFSLLLLAVASSVGAAAGDEFYEGLLRRGLAHYEQGLYDAAIRELRLAAFGLIETPERFEIAQAYIVSAAQRSKREADARGGLQRIIVAEHVERHYASLAIPAAIREDVEKAASALLVSTDLTYLHASSTPAPIPPTPPVATVTPPPPAPMPVPVPVPQPRVEEPVPMPQPAQPQPIPSDDVKSAIAQGDRAIEKGDLEAARTAYVTALKAPQLPRETLLKIGEGLYRARSFRDTTAAFDRVGSFKKGEEPYRYYFAVALYETGHYNAAKRELASALPNIAITPEVERYRVRIEGAIE